MAKENIIRHILRLNMDTKQHVAIHDVIMGLDPNVYKSRNHFLVDAIDFYIENIGKDTFAKAKDQRYVTRDEMAAIKGEIEEEVKKEIVGIAVSEAKNEVIRLMIGAANGVQWGFSANRQAANPQGDEAAPAEDDEIVMENALKWLTEE
jgi:hypothetical protein